MLVPRVLQLAPQLPRPTLGLGGRVGGLATDHLKRRKVRYEGCMNPMIRSGTDQPNTVAGRSGIVQEQYSPNLRTVKTKGAASEQ